MGLKKTPRYALLTVGYAVILNVAYLAALLLRFEGAIPTRFLEGYLRVAPFFTGLSLLGFLVAGLYHGLWRYASTVTLFQVFKGVTLSAAALTFITFFTPTPMFPRSVIVVVWMVELVLLGGLRFAWRLSRERLLGPAPLRAVRTVVVGAGHAGVHLIQEMRRSEQVERLTPIGFVDDEDRFTGHLVEGVPVLGTIADLPHILSERRIGMVVISDPSMPAKVVREISTFCAHARVRVKTLPGLSDLQYGRSTLSQMRDMRIEDLLGRQPVHLDLEQMREFLRGQRVLVTGAGGSIGSELARQIADFAPERLVLLDHAENGLYYVQQELTAQHPQLPMQAVVCDIRDAEGVDLTFDQQRPGVVFHAAAHKHVPLLEANPREAVLNNIVGTRHLVNAADRTGVQKFVLISTDKAVNPTSVMGASKRVCEMICQSRSQRSRTKFVAVRFGNVLGSEGSVIPLFQRQMQRGGPITVTHPDARRYFMTIPEAVRLVLQAGAIGRSGDVLLLDMGEQVRIVDLARQLIRMSGLREKDDVDIVFTGLRPGEKLCEELHSDAERMRLTRHERILVWDLDAREESQVLAEVAELEAVAQDGDADAIREGLRRLVPEYREPKHDPLLPEAAAAAEPVPVRAPARPARPSRRWKESARQLAESTVAASLLLLSAPIWAALFLTALWRGERGVLVYETRVGCNRRREQRRVTGGSMPIDRRSIERRTQDLMGEPVRCARFRADLGPVAAWLERHSLDTLPFLLNVIRCELALVGPRPETEEHVLRWKHLVPDYERRFGVLPGVTGLAQISGYSDGEPRGISRRAQYDLYYVDHRSLLLDVRTLVRTSSVVLRGTGFLRPDGAALPSARANGHAAGNGHPPGNGRVPSHGVGPRAVPLGLSSLDGDARLKSVEAPDVKGVTS